MRNTTLCYLFDGTRVLLLHRDKKDADPNQAKWIGIGGHFLEGESPEECMVREFWEETGLYPVRFQYRGLVTFVSDQWETEFMHLFTADAFCGELKDCDEGTLSWVEWADLPQLPQWEGDRIFLSLLTQPCPFFSLKLSYKGERLHRADLDGIRLPL